MLRPGGRVVIRTTVRERLDSPVYRYWPELLTHDARRFPAEAELLADFTGGGRFAVTRVFSFAQPIARNLAELRDRYALRAESKFGVLSEAEFAAGLARLDAAVSAAPVAGADGADGADGAGGPAEREEKYSNDMTLWCWNGPLSRPDRTRSRPPARFGR